MRTKFLLLLTACLLAAGANAQKKTFIRDYLYQASENDSKNTARAAAVKEMQTLLLMEIGQVIQSEQELKKRVVTKDGKEVFSEDFSQEIRAITAGFVEMKILQESWNGRTYYIEAQITIDPKEVSQRIAKVLDDRQKEKEQAAAQRKEEKNEKTQSGLTGTPAGLTIGGVTWAAANVDDFQTFAERPDTYTKFYQWNRDNSTGRWKTRIRDRAWTINPCPAGWRLPTKEEFEKLNNLGSSWADVGARGNNVAGRFYGTNHLNCSLPDNMNGCVFFPATGCRNYTDGALGAQNSYGYGWSSTQVSSTNGYYLRFHATASFPASNDSKSYGFPVRCVR
jgi:uncharacterized protein (TIGR02145 family)